MYLDLFFKNITIKILLEIVVIFKVKYVQSI